jgi:hypothetical protein
VIRAKTDPPGLDRRAGDGREIDVADDKQRPLHLEEKSNPRNDIQVANIPFQEDV